MCCSYVYVCSTESKSLCMFHSMESDIIFFLLVFCNSLLKKMGGGGFKKLLILILSAHKELFFERS